MEGDPSGALDRAHCGPAFDFDLNQPRDPQGRWSVGAGGASAPPLTIPPAYLPGGTPKAKASGVPESILGQLGIFHPIGTASAQEIDPEEESRVRGADPFDPTAEVRIERYANARSALKEIDPHNQELFTLTPPDYVPSEADIARLGAAAEAALALKADLPPPERLPVPPIVWQLTRLINPELHLRPSPPGLSFVVRGNSTTEVGNSYASQVRAALSGLPGPRSTDLGSANPDALFPTDVGKASVAIEAKYVDEWTESIYNPELRRLFPHNEVEKTVKQAVAYDKTYPGGVEWITNSMEFVEAYAPRFREAGAKNFYFTIIPATREMSR